MTHKILTALLLMVLSGGAAWFARDYKFWRYDRVCIESVGTILDEDE